MELEKLLEFISNLVEADENITENAPYYEEISSRLKTPTDVKTYEEEYNDYKNKYDTLMSDYKKRFVDMINAVNDTPVLEEGFDNPDEEDYNIRNIDFDGETD